jgi:predicted regulator of Ras-like GTPase activity (Roadblock/LC7/MglB family)
VFVVAAGKGSYLAAAAGPDVDMQQISFNMQQLVTRLGRELTAPARTEAGPRRTGGPGTAGGQPPRPARVVPALNEMLAAVPRATRAILVQPDGMPGGASEGMSADIADLFAAAMHGLQGLSKSTGPFAGLHGSPQLRQTVVEFSHGWLVSISTPDGGSVAAMAEPDGDIGELAGRMHDFVLAAARPAAQMARNV